jgi:hypothetical protein
MDAPQPHPGLLFFIPLLLGVQGLVAAVAFARRAPAVSIALVTAIVAAAVRIYLGTGPGRLPIGVMTWASVALGLGGFVGLIVTKPRAGGASTRRWAIGSAAAAFPMALALAFVLMEMCPPYVNRGAGICYWGNEDLLGGWISAVSLEMFLDVMFLAVVLAISAWQADRRAREAADLI